MCRFFFKKSFAISPNSKAHSQLLHALENHKSDNGRIHLVLHAVGIPERRDRDEIKFEVAKGVINLGEVTHYTAEHSI